MNKHRKLDPVFHVPHWLVNCIINQWPMLGEYYTPHGPSHWMQVAMNADKLARAEFSEEDYEQLKQAFGTFALFHDCRRESDGVDIRHGGAAGNLLRTERWLTEGYLSDDLLALVDAACCLHTISSPVSLARETEPFSSGEMLFLSCCFDADRLDIGREGVGIEPDPAYLFTETAKGWLA